MEKNLQTLQTKLDELRVQYHKLGDTIMRTHRQIEKLQIEKEKKNIKSNDYEYLLNNVEGETSYKYDMCNKALHKLGLRTNGYFAETNQKCIQFILDGSNLNKVHKGLQIILPYLFPHENGIIVIDFMEPTLSEFGVYKLELENNIYNITKTTYGHKEIKASFVTLIEALEYIQTNHKMDH